MVRTINDGKRIYCSDGTIWSYYTKRFMRPSQSKSGYLRIYDGKQKKSINIHRLIAEVFLDNPNDHKCVNHKNGIKTDNRLENLEWCNHSYNNREAYKLGLNKGNLTGKNGRLNKIR